MSEVQITWVGNIAAMIASPEDWLEAFMELAKPT